MSAAEQVKQEVGECRHPECEDSNCWFAPQGLHHACECVEPGVCETALSEPDVGAIETEPTVVVSLKEGDYFAARVELNHRTLRRERPEYRVGRWIFRQVSPQMSFKEALAYADEYDEKRKTG